MDQGGEQVRAEDDAEAAVDQVRADYDAAPYGLHSYPQSAPGHLAAIAYLFGLETPEISSARVLEIGCATGGNLIPFAAAHPQARAVGIDLSQVQIEQATERVQKLGLENLRLLQGDISGMDLAALGQFDFIICHGVYSWVPENVREAILSAFAQLLAPEGVGYLSYNVYPGWKSKEIVRDAMLLFGAGVGTPGEKVRRAHSVIDLLAEVAPADSRLAGVLADYRSVAAATRDYYLLHEELEAFNTPCYFLEMVERTFSKGLAYLAEAEPHVMFANNYGAEVGKRLLSEAQNRQALLEQYLDFVVNRTHRQSLLVHADRATLIHYKLDRSRYGRLHFAAWVPPADGESRLDGSRQEYGEPGGARLFTPHSAVKAAVDALCARWPWTLSRDELLETVHARLAAAGIDAADLEARVDELLEILILQGHVRYRLDPVLPEPASTPWRLDEPVRRMAELTCGDAEALTFNSWHDLVPLSPVDRYLLPLLDGTRDRAALVEELLAIARQDLIRFQRGGKPSSEAQLREAIAEQIDTMPQRLTEMKLLRTGERQSRSRDSTRKSSEPARLPRQPRRRTARRRRR